MMVSCLANKHLGALDALQGQVWFSAPSMTAPTECRGTRRPVPVYLKPAGFPVQWANSNPGERQAGKPVSRLSGDFLSNRDH